MTAVLEETVPYGMRGMVLVERDYYDHPADACHIDPVTQLITDGDGQPVSMTIDMATGTTTSGTSKHANGQEEWGNDDE